MLVVNWHEVRAAIKLPLWAEAYAVPLRFADYTGDYRRKMKDRPQELTWPSRHDSGVYFGDDGQVVSRTEVILQPGSSMGWKRKSA